VATGAFEECDGATAKNIIPVPKSCEVFGVVTVDETLVSEKHAADHGGGEAVEIERGAGEFGEGNRALAEVGGPGGGGAVEVEAETMGHDMFWGTSAYTRTPASLSEYENN